MEVSIGSWFSHKNNIWIWDWVCRWLTAFSLWKSLHKPTKPSADWWSSSKLNYMWFKRIYWLPLQHNSHVRHNVLTQKFSGRQTIAQLSASPKPWSSPVANHWALSPFLLEVPHHSANVWKTPPSRSSSTSTNALSWSSTHTSMHPHSPGFLFYEASAAVFPYHFLPVSSLNALKPGSYCSIMWKTPWGSNIVLKVLAGTLGKEMF